MCSCGDSHLAGLNPRGPFMFPVATLSPFVEDTEDVSLEPLLFLPSLPKSSLGFWKKCRLRDTCFLSLPT